MDTSSSLLGRNWANESVLQPLVLFFSPSLQPRDSKNSLSENDGSLILWSQKIVPGVIFKYRNMISHKNSWKKQQQHASQVSFASYWNACLWYWHFEYLIAIYSLDFNALSMFKIGGRRGIPVVPLTFQTNSKFWMLASHTPCQGVDNYFKTPDFQNSWEVWRTFLKTVRSAATMRLFSDSALKAEYQGSPSSNSDW